MPRRIRRTRPSRRPGARLRGAVAAGAGAVGLLGLLAGCGGPGREGPAATASSALLVTIDTWRADVLGAGGDPIVRTPWLDRFFRTGAQFGQAYSPVPTTLSSHTSILTGAWPTRHGVPGNLWPVPDDVRTLAEILAGEGFATAAFLSSAALSREFRLDQGFATYNFKATALAEAEAPWRPAFRTLHRGLTWWSETEGRRFLWVHLWEPHVPYEVDPRLVALYDPDYEGPADGSMAYLAGLWQSPDPPPARDRAHLVAMYRAEVTTVDRAVGLFLDGIDATDAIVVVTSDHGESMGEHNLQFKHGPQVFPADVQVPLAVRAPGLAPAVTNAMVRTIDIARTVLDGLGVAADLPPEADELLRWTAGGEGLPAFGVATQPWSETLEAHDVFPLEPLQRIVRTPEAAYMETPFRDLRAYFDRTRDPGEAVPVAPADPALADSLRDALDAWIDAGRVIPGYRPVRDEGLREQLRSLGYLD